MIKEGQPLQKNSVDEVIKYFETYEVKESDLKILEEGIEVLCESKLIENEILDNIRFVTYDSKYFYIFTRGKHSTNDRFVVEEIVLSNRSGFKIFKIQHSGLIGRIKKDYGGGRAWLLCDEIETTAINAKKFPNSNILYERQLSQPKEILDVISIPPIEPYNKIQGDRYNYLTDIIFHEAGHIEYRRLRNWQEDKGLLAPFPFKEQKERFLTIIRQTKIFPDWIIDIIIENITESVLSEMYAMLIDREAAKRYDVLRFNKENIEFEKVFFNFTEKFKIESEMTVEKFREFVSDPHILGRLLVRILEEQFPNFIERKNFVRSVLAS